jgi:hypothetical protein
LDKVLPTAVTSAVVRGIREFGTDTTSLLHEVYRTKPMLGAPPGAFLDFQLAVSPPEAKERNAQQVDVPTLTVKQEKKRKEALRALRARVQQQLRERQDSTLVEPPTPPRYDEAFHQGVQWLDSLAGEAPGQEEGHLRFSDEIWTAPGRGDLSGD